MKPRSPPACIICSPPESIKKYQAVGKVGRLFPGKSGIDDKLVLMKKISEFPEKYNFTITDGEGKPIAAQPQTKRAGQPLEFICSKCAWCRPNPEAEVDGVTFMWYQSCAKCGERHITTELGKCAHCDLGLL